MKKLPLHKHFFLVFVVLILNLSAVTDLYGDDALKNSELIFIGEDGAPVEIKVFSSLTCPHCAKFHNDVLPKIKKEFVETGDAKIILTDFPLNLPLLKSSKSSFLTELMLPLKYFNKIEYILSLKVCFLGAIYIIL